MACTACCIFHSTIYTSKRTLVSIYIIHWHTHTNTPNSHLKWSKVVCIVKWYMGIVLNQWVFYLVLNCLMYNVNYLLVILMSLNNYHMYVHTHTHKYAHAFTHPHTHAYNYTHKHTHMHVELYLRVNILFPVDQMTISLLTSLTMGHLEYLPFHSLRSVIMSLSSLVAYVAFTLCWLYVLLLL